MREIPVILLPKNGIEGYFCLKSYRMKKLVFAVFVLGAVAADAFAQHVVFPDDALGRGYFDRPYKRYEAEPGKCEASPGVLFLETSYTQTELQSEASNQCAAQLPGDGAYLEWTNGEAADGLTIRFSLPDSEDGKGTKCNLSLYVDGSFVRDIALDSYWAWQYTLKSGDNKYPDNTPSADKFARMRFDEIHVRLDAKIPAGAKVRLAKKDGQNPCTVDFIELEPVPAPVAFEDIQDENKVMFDGSALISFINKNGGKTIYVPAGDYIVARRIPINVDGTKLVGAGMWYTNIYFSASSDDRSSYSQRGFETDCSNIEISGMYINTINNKRYYDNNDAYQVGKGLMGSFGMNSVIRDVWIEHFECGGWIANYNNVNSGNLLIQNCRFRNNYADGINLCSGIRNAVVEKCSFRNNGDDDMASWTSNAMCENNTFRFNTAENNWRASSLGFFGGKQNKAHHIVVIDPMEAGIRVTCDFPGQGFSTDGYNEYSDISIYRAGAKAGQVGTDGDFWGNRQGAIHIEASSRYDLDNFRMSNIDVLDSKNDAIHIACGSRRINNLLLSGIHVNGTEGYGIYYGRSVVGSGTYCVTFENIGAGNATNGLSPNFNFVEDCDDAETAAIEAENDSIRVCSAEKGVITVIGCRNVPVAVSDMAGNEVYRRTADADTVRIRGLHHGVYIVCHGNHAAGSKVVVR